MTGDSQLETCTQTLAVLVGIAAIALATASYLTGMAPAKVVQWVHQYMGYSFLLILAGLSGLALFAWLGLYHGRAGRATYVMGIHAANGIATAALTYTLYGISKGIGGLAQSSLSPETVGGIIAELTAGFQLAFITTVVGLPISALLRAMLHVTGSRLIEAQTR